MTEAELRGHLLKKVFDLRENAGGWVPTSEMNFGGMPVTRDAIGLTGQHLADAGLIDWKPLHGESEGFVIGMARITGHGIDVVRKNAKPRIEIALPGNSSAEAPAVKPPHVPDNHNWEVAAQVAVDARREANAAVVNAGAGTVLPPLSADVKQGAVSIGAAAALTANAELVPATVPITLTHYPQDAGGAIVVHNHITINVHTSEFEEFTTKLDELVTELRRSNEFSVEVREKLVGELTAGKEIIAAPKPDRNYVELLLVRPLRYLADKAGSAVISQVASGMLKLLGKITGLW